LTSDEYARDFNEVKALGSATSTTRTADQTLVARLWAGVDTTPTFPFAVWNNVARTVAIQRNTTTAENARLFAPAEHFVTRRAANDVRRKISIRFVATGDGDSPRDEDGNPDTAPDVNWSSLIGNPPYPSYPGNVAAVGTSQATILALFLRARRYSFPTYVGRRGRRDALVCRI
jgi:hypothetical protein